MKLRYQNNVEDLVASNRYFLERSPLLRQQAWLMAVLVFVMIMAFMFLFQRWDHDPWVLQDELDSLRGMWLVVMFTAATATALAVFFLWKPYLLYNNGRTVRKLFRYNPDKVALAERELEITGGYLVERNEYGEFRWKLGAIEKVGVTADHVFVRISSMRAYILPRDAVDEAELEHFLEELKYARRQPPPIPVAPVPEAPAPARSAERGGEHADAIQVRDRPRQ